MNDVLEPTGRSCRFAWPGRCGPGFDAAREPEPRVVGSETREVGDMAHVYKVLTQKDRFFKGKFDPMKLEEALNAYAGEGWKVVGTATAEFPGIGNRRQEIVVVMEREH